MLSILLSLLVFSSAVSSSAPGPTPTLEVDTPRNQTLPYVPYDVAAPGHTPAYLPHGETKLLDFALISNHRWLSAVSYATGAAVGNSTGWIGVSLATTLSNCLDSSVNADIINTLLSQGDAGAIINLCPGAIISLSNTIVFTAAGQTIRTIGWDSSSTTDSRALLKVSNRRRGNLVTAILASCARCSNATIINIKVSRPLHLTLS